VVTVILPGPLRQLAAGAPEVAAEGCDVAEVLSSLAVRQPRLADRILDEEGKPRRFLRLYLNDRDIAAHRQLETPVAEGDRLTVVLAVAGG